MERTHVMNEREMELARLLMTEYHATGDAQAKLKKLLMETTAETVETATGKRRSAAITANAR